MRCAKLRNRGDIAAAEAHARGVTSNARGRHVEGARIRALAYGTGPRGELRGGAVPVDDTGRVPDRAIESAPMCLGASFDRHLGRAGGRLRKGACVGMHLLVGVSPEWVAAAGDPHDVKRNRRVKQLLDAAILWAQSALGGGVWAARYDANEAGSGVVDVFCSPVHAYGQSDARFVSVNKSLTALARKHGRTKSYQALQDSWAAAAQQHLDPAFARGEPSDREHLVAEHYGARKDAQAAIAGAERARKDAHAAGAEAERKAREAHREAAEELDAAGHLVAARGRDAAGAIETAEDVLRHLPAHLAVRGHRGGAQTVRDVVRTLADVRAELAALGDDALAAVARTSLRRQTDDERARIATARAEAQRRGLTVEVERKRRGPGHGRQLAARGPQGGARTDPPTPS